MVIRKLFIVVLVACSLLILLYLQWNPTIRIGRYSQTADLRTGEKAVLGVIYNLQNPYLGLGNGQRYWGEAVLGTTVLNSSYQRRKIWRFV